MVAGTVGRLASSDAIARHPGNPVLTSHDVPYPSTLVFNPGVAKFGGRYVMAFRNDYGRAGDPHFDGTNIGLAWSDDGVRWEVTDRPCFHMSSDEIRRAYDPRLIVIDGRCYVCFAVDTRHGVRGGIAVTDDFQRFRVLSMSVPDNRNMVLFPERIGGVYIRLERPFPVYGRGGVERFDIWISDSPDLRYWGNPELLLAVEQVGYANTKLGPAAPPVKTGKGWLTTFHAVDTDTSRGKNGWEARWQKRYTAGLMLLDLDDPRQVVGLYEEPLIAPEASYEVEGGFRNNVVFPCGLVLEPSGEVKIYYGAADTVVGLATADVDALLKLCTG
jgi:beta-1,4-mannooligosaccharide/beta-1,4-mannosyl-N-acetylglucosamine phosphorylase